MFSICTLVSPSSNNTYLLDLPNEILEKIFHYLSWMELQKLYNVGSERLETIAKDVNCGRCKFSNSNRIGFFFIYNSMCIFLQTKY